MISLSLGRDLEDRLAEAADESGASTGEIVARAVEQYLEFRESRLGAAREARAQADKGIFISQAKMHA